MNTFPAIQEEGLKFPITVRMKLLALAPQFYVSDKDGKAIAYVKQKLFKLKEDIRIYANEQQNKQLYAIAADRVIDFNAAYSISDSQTGKNLGSVKRKGMRSLWKAAYEVHDNNGAPKYFISEESAFVRLLDGIFSELPIIGLFSGYVFNPCYLVKDTAGKTVARMKKQPAMWEGVFKMETFADLPAPEQKQLMLSLFTVLLLERMRG